MPSLSPGRRARSPSAALTSATFSMTVVSSRTRRPNSGSWRSKAKTRTSSRLDRTSDSRQRICVAPAPSPIAANPARVRPGVGRRRSGRNDARPFSPSYDRICGDGRHCCRLERRPCARSGERGSDAAGNTQSRAAAAARRLEFADRPGQGTVRAQDDAACRPGALDRRLCRRLPRRRRRAADQRPGLAGDAAVAQSQLG